MVHISAYRHGDQWDIVIGWKIAVIVDQSTGLLVWKLFSQLV